MIGASHCTYHIRYVQFATILPYWTCIPSPVGRLGFRSKG